MTPEQREEINRVWHEMYGKTLERLAKRKAKKNRPLLTTWNHVKVTTGFSPKKSPN